jgi:hypothetical protein
MVRRIQLEERSALDWRFTTALAAANFSEGRPRLLDLVQLASRTGILDASSLCDRVLKQLGPPLAMAATSRSPMHPPRMLVSAYSRGRPRLVVLLQLRAEPSSSGEPGRGVAQVDRQLPGAEIPVLGQAAADCGLGDQQRQAHVGRVRARVGPPVLLVLAC